MDDLGAYVVRLQWPPCIVLAVSYDKTIGWNSRNMYSLNIGVGRRREGNRSTDAIFELPFFVEATKPPAAKAELHHISEPTPWRYLQAKGCFQRSFSPHSGHLISPSNLCHTDSRVSTSATTSSGGMGRPSSSMQRRNPRRS